MIAAILMVVALRCKKQGETIALFFSRKCIMASTNTTKAPSPWQTLNSQGVLRIPTMNARTHPQVDKQNNYKISNIKIGTWNARSLYTTGKAHNIIREMERLNISVLGVSEVRWPKAGKTNIGNYTMYYSGNDDPNHYNGVAVILNEVSSRTVLNFVPLSDRVMLLQMRAHPQNINIIQVYAPTSDKSEVEVQQFYAQLKQLLNVTKKHEVNIIMGDFNAKVGTGAVGDVMGEYGLGERNARGESLIEFCQEESLVVMNTWFTLPKRRLYTWISPRDHNGNVVRNQIDYILVNKRYRNGVRGVKTYPGADIESDHVLLTGIINIKLKHIQTAKNVRPNFRLLRNPEIRSQVTETLNQEISQTISVGHLLSVEATLESFKNICVKVQNEKLNMPTKTAKREWMTQKVLGLMDERRRYKNNNKTKYKEISKQIRKLIRKAKEKWMEEQCQEMEELRLKHDYFSMYKKVKEVTGQNSTRTPTYLINGNNQILTEQKELEEEWARYIKNTFDDDRELPELITDGISLNILPAEVRDAIKHAKTGRAPGPDNLCAEMFQLLNEENISILCSCINSIYSTGTIPRDWLKSMFIPLPKKPNANRCEQYRLISLMSHALKVTLKIIHHRIRNKCEQDVGEEQFGFRQGFGTREALFGLNVFLQKCRDQRKDVYLCFIDYEKAFDRVKHSQLIQMLQNIGLDENDIRFITHLYWDQVATIRVNSRETEEIGIKRGVRQGCVLSPLLFNLYSEHIFRKALENATDGIKVNGKIINNLRYADDTVIIADTADGLQRLMNNISREGDVLGMKVNVNKTKVMVISRTPGLQTDIRVYDQLIEQVNKFKYLGCWVTNDLNPEIEVRVRTEMARAAFLKMRHLLTDSTLSLDTRYRFVKVYIYPVLLYGVEAWTLGVRSMNRLESFELWVMRRILKISWTERVTNEDVLRRMGRERELLSFIKRQKTRYLGHIYRGPRYSLLRLLMEGKVEGKRGVGRRKCSWLKNIRDWTGLDTHTLLRIAQDREEFAVITAQLQ